MDYSALENQALAQGQQAAAQGQQLFNQYQGNATNYQNQYNTETQAAQQANQNLSDYTDYMKNAGNPLNLYNQGISQAETAQGFDPNSLATATQNLTQTQNALANVNNASQSSTGGYGLSGGQLGAYYGSLSQPLQQAAQAQNTSVGNLQQLYQNSLTQGQQGAALGFQGEQQTSQNLNQVYQNNLAQANQYLQQMQYYSGLAQQQGGLNAQQQQAYNSIAQGYAQTKATVAQLEAAANLANQQATGQGLTNQGLQNTLNSQAAAQAAKAAQAQSNAEYAAMGGTATKAKAPTSSNNNSGGFSISNLFKNFASL